MASYGPSVHCPLPEHQRISLEITVPQDEDMLAEWLARFE